MNKWTHYDVDGHALCDHRIFNPEKLTKVESMVTCGPCAELMK